MDIPAPVTVKKLAKRAARFIKNNVIEISSTNIDTFINDSPAVPKVLLFSDKKRTPFIFKALSAAFEKKLFFGMVNSEDVILTKRYRIKSFPKIVVVKATERKPIPYSGEIKYPLIFKFLNIYAETFVAGGGSS